MGTLKDAFPNATSAVSTFTGAIKNGESALSVFKTGLSGLWKVISANPIGTIVTVVGIVSSVVSHYNKKAEEIRKATLESGTAAKKEADNVLELYSVYQQNRQAYLSNAGSKDALTSSTDALLNALGIERNEIQNLAEEYQSLDTAINKVAENALLQESTKISAAYGESVDSLKDTYENLDSVIEFKGNSDKKLKKYLQSNDIPLAYGGVYDSSLNTIDLYGIEKYEAVYDELVKIQELAQKSIAEDAMTQDDVSKSEFLKEIELQKKSLEEQLDIAHGYRDTLNQIQSQIIFNDVSGKIGIPKNQESFNSFRDAMLEAAIAGETFLGTEQDIEYSIDEFLSSMPALSNFSDHLANSATATAEQLSSLKEGFENSDVSKWFDSLSENQKQLVFDISVRSDGSNLWTLEKWKNELEHIEKHGISSQESLSSFYTVLNGGDDQSGFTATIENNISKIETLKELLSKIDSGELNSTDKLNFIKDFPSLAQYADDTDNLREAVSNLIGETSQGINNTFNEQLKSMGEDGSAAYESMSNLQSIVQSICKIDGWNFDLEVATSSTQSLINNISSAHELISKQSTGRSISIEDFNSEELADYRSALEYTNGTMQLNADKVNEIVKAKADEQIALNNTNKAIAQSKYLENAKQIEKYRDQLRMASSADADSRSQIENNIESLLAENSAIAETCSQYDLLSVSLQEATGAYQNWLNAQSATDYGDMFNDALSAIKLIRDTYTDGTEATNNFGSKKFDAAVDFIIPDEIDHDDTDAIQSYMENLKQYFTFDDNGNSVGMDIMRFCQNAVDQGLMVVDEASNEFKIAGGKTMEDFAEGLNMSSGMVQAFFDEMQLKGGEFDWSDEAVKTIGDLAVEANEAAEALRNFDGNKDLKIKMDVSDIEDTQGQLDALDETISEMDRVKTKASVDDSEIEKANAVIQYCLTQKQLLSQPDVMRVDTSQAEGDIGNVLSLLQQFHDTQNNLEIKQKIGADTSQAQAKLDSLTTEIQSISPDIKAKLSLDTTSQQSISASIASLTAETINVKAGVDASAIEGYDPESKSCEVIYDPNTDSLPKSFSPVTRRVNYYAITSNLPKEFTTITRYVKYERKDDAEVNGTAHVGGTAKVGGDWGTARGGKTLVGELGREIVVDPRTGKWYTVGDNGAEFRDIPTGAIVFNHIQSKSLLENGYVSGRASALVSGTAMVTGGIKVPNSTNGGNGVNSNTSSGNLSNKYSGSSSSSKTSNSSSKTDKDLETVDWIEIAIDRIERAIDHLKATAESAFKSLKTRLGASTDEIAKINEELIIQQKAYDRYIQEANSVGLSAELADKVRNGTIDINKYDSDTQELISSYREWYEKALDCSDSVDELHESLASLYEDNFNNIQTDFDNQLSMLEHLSNTYENRIDTLEAKGYLESTKYYSDLQNVERQNLSLLNKELSELTKSFADAMASGEIEEGSEAWYDFKLSILDTNEAIDEANLSLLEYKQTMREIEWGYFDYIQDRISQVTSEADFLIDTLSNVDLYKENGQFNDEGLATLGLRAQNYNVYMVQSDQYAKEILALDKEIANDPYNTDLIERREKLLELQQDSISAAEDEKQSIVDLVEEGINIELDALQNLIDAYTDSLDSARDLYEYQKKIEEKSADIASLEKQLSAYENDTSEETRSKIQQIKVDLSEARADLAETEYDQFVSDTKKLLDDLYDEYESILNERLDDVDTLISDMIDSVNMNSANISDILIKISDKIGYTMSQGMQDIWSNKNTSEAIVTKYGDGFTAQLTSVNELLNSIQRNVASMAAESNKAAISSDSNVSVPILKATSENNLSAIISKMKEQEPSEITFGYTTYNAAPQKYNNIAEFSNGISKRVSGYESPVINHNTEVTFGDIMIDHVEDYNDFVNQLKRDKQFEQLIQSMTTDRLSGGSPLTKHKFRW